MKSHLERFFQNQVRRKLKRFAQALEATQDRIRALSDAQLQTHFHGLKNLPDELPEALGLVKEAARRALSLDPYPVQLQAAAVLFDGVIAQMNTGEGKTLVIALSACIYALEGKGVHIVTPNAYLAQRDEAAMRPLFAFLNLSSGIIVPGQNLGEKQYAYACDITYGVHSEFGFDYLRDHQVAHASQQVQRGRHYAIVDEADLVLIDEAHTPLILSGHSQEGLATLATILEALNPFVQGQDLEVDYKARTVHLTNSGLERLAKGLIRSGLIPTEEALYREEKLHLMQQVEAVLRARFLFLKDRDYVVQNGKILIIDEATGRTLVGRQWQGGVHQAIALKEGLIAEPETLTAGEVTYQGYFHQYQKLSGLTGTALPAKEEFESLYGCHVIVISPHKPCVRRDLPDRLFVDKASKFRALVDDIYVRHQAHQPVLLGTSSVAESEALSEWLTWAGLPHQVLNARQNAQEAEVISQAGLPGAITIATNMAGRGTDILLGGPATEAGNTANKSTVIAAGGLHVLVSQRQESARVDAQLKGRAGRQGDPGSSQFYVCLEDPLLQIFGGLYLGRLATFFGKDPETKRTGLLTRAIRKAQEGRQAQAFGARLALFKAESAVLTPQRTEAYGLREEILRSEDPAPYARQVLTDVIKRLAASFLEAGSAPEEWELSALDAALDNLYHIQAPLLKASPTGERLAQEFTQELVNECLDAFSQSAHDLDRIRLCLLTALDQAWARHLAALSGLRESIHLRAFAQENPEHAYAKEAYAAFGVFQREYEEEAALLLSAVLAKPDKETSMTTQPYIRPVSRLADCPCGSGRRYKDCHGSLIAKAEPTSAAAAVKPYVRPISRLAPCPCGSKRRYKDCHGKLAKATDESISLHHLQSTNVVARTPQKPLGAVNLLKTAAGTQ